MAANEAELEPGGADLAAEHRALKRKLEKVIAISDLYEAQLRAARRDLKQLQDLFLPICMFCKRVRTDDAYWEKIERYFSRHAAVTFSHGICPSCMQERFGDHPGAAHAAVDDAAAVPLRPPEPAPAPPPARTGGLDEAALDDLAALVASPELCGVPLAPALRAAVDRCARLLGRYRKVVDISDGYQEEFQQRLERAVRHDALTGLASRAAAIQAIEEAADRQRRGAPATALALLRVDGLGAVNRDHGYGAGDRILIALARALRTGLSRAFVRARWDGTVFAALLPADAEDGVEAAARSLRAVAVVHGAHAIGVEIRAAVARSDAAPSAAGWVAAAEDALRGAPADAPNGTAPLER